ncbi:MscL family protein [Gordonia sp. CPCC 205515]|uniref:large conductance mechanosensitive channel protein MscL n=1 Tax=Gordonia sp. CPCC 205515 TaxID=3140791 RepID=UPI003AF3DF73
MLKGFKEFILKGNVVELATAVIIGAAFTAIVTAFTTSIISPLFAAIPTGNGDCGGGTEVAGTDTTIAAPVQTCGFGFRIVSDNPATFMDFGALFAAVINFLIIAAVVYFLIIVPYNKLTALGGYSKKAEVSEISLLTEIRDLLDPEGSSRAKEEAEKELPPHLKDPAGPPSGGTPVPVGAGNDPGVTQRLTTPPPQAAPPQPSGPPQSAPPQSAPPQSAPPQSAPSANPPYPTPQPGPGNYPPPGTYPPGNFPPQRYPGDYPDGPGRHSR